MLNKEDHNLVSVIIPCYNHGSYLPTAIQSIVEQDYRKIEIIVVDDGSTDNTKEMTLRYPEVKYLYQQNKGLSAARNAGINISQGAFLIFLDADDWLLPHAIQTNLKYLQKNEKLAFVSGGHIKVFNNDNIITETQEVKSEHFKNLLRGNYIGMHATVMYSRWIFNHFLFDETLKNCEDYDLYLKITRLHPVVHHTDLIAAYRFHNTNMSGNIPAMLKGVLNVLEKQKNILKDPEEKEAYHEGKRIWKDYYSETLYKGLLLGKIRFNTKVFKILLQHKPLLLLKYLIKNRLDVKKSHTKISTHL